MHQKMFTKKELKIADANIYVPRLKQSPKNPQGKEKRGYT